MLIALIVGQQRWWCPMCGGAAHWGWGMMISSILFWLVLLLAVILLARWLGAARRGSGADEPGSARRPSPDEILAERYARGEIDRETYLRMREDLRGPPPA
ncbi:MAG TPA: SHOCT domain-containing protein [Gemmatimonadaceae bacterium]|nr:SHOCT domain-containing protein [Gemmatimonadaceae bacterium]